MSLEGKLRVRDLVTILAPAYFPTYPSPPPSSHAALPLLGPAASLLPLPGNSFP